jgi:hypothetical protein
MDLSISFATLYNINSFGILGGIQIETQTDICVHYQPRTLPKQRVLLPISA